MDRDPSYAEYVDARWFVLYRLGALLVGDDRAGSLTEEALVQAYLRWPEVQQAASSDGFVEGLLARTAVEEFATGGSEGDGLGALPIRPRTIIVLWCFELLDLREVGEALGERTADVESEAEAALAALGLSGQEVAEELARRTAAISVPAPPVEDLVARGRATLRLRRRHTHRRWVAGAVVAIAALAVTSLVSPARDSGPAHPRVPIPTALARLPAGSAPRAAYSDGLTLQTPAGPVILPHWPVALAQAGHWLYLTYRSGTVDQIDARSFATTTLTPAAAGQVVTDSSGRWVGWLEAGPDVGPYVAAVRAADSATSPLHEQPFPRGGRLVLAGLTRAGELVVTSTVENRAWVWHTGLGSTPEQPQVEEISGLGNGGIGQVTGDDLVLGHVLYFAAGDLRDGTFFVEDELEARQADFTDPLGRRIVYLDEEGRAFVRQRASRGRPHPAPAVRLGLPAGLEQRGVRWEDASHVLLDVEDASLPLGALVRCDVRTGACELAARFDGPHLLAR
jgi:hypothetical protein